MVWIIIHMDLGQGDCSSKKQEISYILHVQALICARYWMKQKDAQCNTEESP